MLWHGRGSTASGHYVAYARDRHNRWPVTSVTSAPCCGWFRNGFGVLQNSTGFPGFPKFPEFPEFPKLRFHIDDETARQVQWQDVEESGARAATLGRWLGRWTAVRCHVSPPRSEAKSARFGAVLYGGDSCGYGSLASQENRITNRPTGGKRSPTK